MIGVGVDPVPFSSSMPLLPCSCQDTLKVAVMRHITPHSFSPSKISPAAFIGTVNFPSYTDQRGTPNYINNVPSFSHMHTHRNTLYNTHARTQVPASYF